MTTCSCVLFTSAKQTVAEPMLNLVIFAMLSSLQLLYSTLQNNLTYVFCLENYYEVEMIMLHMMACLAQV